MTFFFLFFVFLGIMVLLNLMAYNSTTLKHKVTGTLMLFLDISYMGFKKIRISQKVK